MAEGNKSKNMDTSTFLILTQVQTHQKKMEKSKMYRQLGKLNSSIQTAGTHPLILLVEKRGNSQPVS
jgi:hypothetical protein